jgi:D-lyxose ketol-isomerase
MPRRPKKPLPPLPELAPGQLLDWSDRSHWWEKPLPCRYCERLTHLLDEQRRPAHKTCAEEDGVRRGAKTLAAYRTRRDPAG